MAEVSLEDAMQMGGPEIFGYARKHRLSLSGCSTVDQFRQRLVLHLQAQKGAYFDIQREFGTRHSESLDSIRQTLDVLLGNVQEAMSDLDPTLEQALRMDSGGSDEVASLVKQIQHRRRKLMTSQCSVIVAGETNAGKSTFLNLMLGMNVLPISIFSCTAAVCVLKYSTDFSAEVVFHNGRRERKAFQGEDETRDWLENMVAEKNQEKRQQGLDIRSIHVRLPAVILQSGVTLVDTPGIGENEAMTSCTMDYVKRNSAAAYLYIIKTDNAGGIHDDRLLEFLRAILQHNEEDKSAEVFDPASAMFICNRWDQVPPEQQEAVRDNALSKLKDVWPNFEAQQAFFLSSINAQIHYSADPRYVTEDYEETLRGVKEVFGKARHNAINQHYRWLKQLLHQSTSFLQTAIHNCRHTDEELIARFKASKEKLDALQYRTTLTTEHLRQQLREEIARLCQSMAHILQEADVKKEIMDWSHQDIPKCTNYGTKEVKHWQEEVDTRIMRRIMEKVDEELQRRGLDQQLQERLKRLAQSELQLVDEEINSILEDMSDRNSLSSSLSSNSSSMSGSSEDESVLEMLRVYKERNGFRVARLRNVSRVTEASVRTPSRGTSEATMNNVRKLMLGKMLKRILAPMAKMMEGVRTRRRQSVFSENPVKYMAEQSERVIKVVADSKDCLAQMAAKHYEKLEAFIADVDNSIPRFIASNKQVMEDIKLNRKTYLARRNELIGVMEALEPIREMLRGFGSLYIRDVTADNIHFILDVEQRRQSVAVSVMDKGKMHKDSGIGDSKSTYSSGSSISSSQTPTSGRNSRTSQGLWSTYRWGHVAIGKEKKNVMGRSYIQPLHENVLIKEIARLRCLRSDDLAPFLGMSRMEDSAVFLFMGDLIPAGRYLRKGFHEPRESVPRLLQGILRGLSYLHHEGLVHMELTLDTVMVSREGDPRLCGACLPRKARFPPDAGRVDAEPFVCLSPEVLRGDLYVCEDDCYSFGLVVFETCLREKPYSDQRSQLSLEEFRNQVHPSSMLGLDSHPSALTENLSAILRGCLLPARGLRMKMDELQKRVSALRHDLQSSELLEDQMLQQEEISRWTSSSGEESD